MLEYPAEGIVGGSGANATQSNEISYFCCLSELLPQTVEVRALEAT